MQAVRRLFGVSATSNGRDTYDALPLSDLRQDQTTHSSPFSGTTSRPPSSPVTLRKVIITILSTILALTAVFTAFSLFDTNLDFETTSNQAWSTAEGPDNGNVELSGVGLFYRDAYPIRSMVKYFEVAEREVKARGLDTCDGQLGRELIDAYARSAIDYCRPHVRRRSPSAQERKDIQLNIYQDGIMDATTITCAPVHHDDFSRWWPHPLSPCFSTNLHPIKDTYTSYHADSCTLTEEGEQLKAEMLDGDQKDQKFVGTDIQDVEGEGGAGTCKSLLNRTIIEIPRQDQWNP
jgi:hypothetical protein